MAKLKSKLHCGACKVDVENWKEHVRTEKHRSAVGEVNKVINIMMGGDKVVGNIDEIMGDGKIIEKRTARVLRVRFCRKCGVELTEDNQYKSSKEHGNYICKTCFRRQTRPLSRDYRRENLEATTKSKGTRLCPKCGKKGQLKLRTARNKKTGTVSAYYEVDHYKGPGHTNYERCCYLGKELN